MITRCGKSLRLMLVPLLLALCLVRDADAVVANFRAVYTPVDGWGGRVPTVWEVIHSVGLGGRVRLSVEGLYLESPSNFGGGIFLTVVDHQAWHGWYGWINAVADSDPEAAWTRSSLLCSAPAVLRVELDNQGNSSTLNSHVPLDFSDRAMFDPDPEKRSSTRTAYEFFAFGLYSVHLVRCRAGDSGYQAVEDSRAIPMTVISGRVTISTEARTMMPNLLTPTPYEQQITQRVPTTSTTTTMHTTRLHELAYGETPYPTVWLIFIIVNTFLLSQWVLTLSFCPSGFLRRGRIRGFLLPILATLSLAAKSSEALLKFAHYDRIRRGYPMLVVLSFSGSIFRTLSTSVLILLLAIGALGIGITRSSSQIYIREAVVLSIAISTHFVMGLSQAFCPANQSPTAVELPTSSGSLSRRTNATIYNKFYSGLLIESSTSSADTVVSTGRQVSVRARNIDKEVALRGRALDEYYLSADACNVIVFNEYLLQALIILVIIVAMNFNIAKLRQHLSSNRWDGGSARLYDKLHGMYMLRRSFLMFLLAPTILLVVQIMLLTWRYTWLMTLMVETVSVFIYWYLGKALFQQAENPFAEQLPQTEDARRTSGRAMSRGRPRPRTGSATGHRAETIPVVDLGGGDEEEEEETRAVTEEGGAGESKKESDSGDGTEPVLEIDLDW